MGKSLRTLICLGFAIILLSGISYAKEVKIAYINVLEIFDSYKKTETYDKQLEKLQDEKQKPFKDMANDLKKLKEKYDMVKDSEKESIQKQLTEKATEYQKKEREVVTELKGERDKKMKEIVDDINAAVKKYAQEKKYDYVLNETMVVYGDPASDITKDILTILNSSYPSAGSKK